MYTVIIIHSLVSLLNFLHSWRSKKWTDHLSRKWIASVSTALICIHHTEWTLFSLVIDSVVVVVFVSYFCANVCPFKNPVNSRTYYTVVLSMWRNDNVSGAKACVILIINLRINCTEQDTKKNYYYNVLLYLVYFFSRLPQFIMRIMCVCVFFFLFHF